MENKVIERKTYLDVIKIISAFMIVVYHFGRLDFGGLVNGEYIANFNRVFENINVISIPAFFMVNGALIFKKKYDTKTIYTKAAQIALITFVWSFTGFPSWFFKTLIVVYLLYPVLIKIYENKTLRFLLCAFLFVMPFMYNFVMVLLMKFAPDFSLNILGRTISLGTLPTRTGFFTLYSILYMFIGMYLSEKDIKPYFSIPLIILGIGVVTWEGMAVSSYNGEVFDSVNGCFQTVGAMIASIGFFALIKCIKFNNDKFIKITTFLGSRVLYVYLFHVFIIHKLLWEYVLTAKHYNIPIVLAVAVLIYAVSMVIGIILEKIPYVKYLVKM